jgi:NAD(P)-dependent dehydrogenase (short-subunit alcohol dehydrogenase family)
MDLADFESVKNAARVVRDGAERIHVLMLNAGIVSPLSPRKRDEMKPSCPNLS